MSGLGIERGDIVGAVVIGAFFGGAACAGWNIVKVVGGWLIGAIATLVIG